MSTHFIAAPYDSGRHNWRLGTGVTHWFKTGILDDLRGQGAEITQSEIVLPDDGKAEVALAFAVAQEIAREVRAAGEKGALPVVLAGNCASAWGTVAGIRDQNPAIIWFDAHADLNTPETSTSGFLDGMSLAVATGRGWRNMTHAIEGFQPVEDRNVVVVGARDFDPSEQELIDRGHIALARRLTELRDKLEDLRSRCNVAYVHLDLDVIDAAEGRANQFAIGGGWSGADVITALDLIRQYLSIGAIGITAYNPAVDTDRAVEQIGLSVIRNLVQSPMPRRA